MYINALLNQWNYLLSIYLYNLAHKYPFSPSKYKLYESKRLNPWNYYHKVWMWSLHPILKDDELRGNVNNAIWERNLNDTSKYLKDQ